MTPIQMAAKFFDARDIVRKMTGLRYHEIVGPWRDHLRDKKPNFVQAAIPMMKKLQDEGKVVGVEIVLAACADLADEEDKKAVKR